ncbi:L,D-transpeptidase [Acuticoccus sp. I52.16.1]|uniref:L,D-transpeptidase n=1 Tax=Acuticoccus sp. I52.16.1 TaxID=2928472 RepID=UPI001FD08070|nr:L,D-transpeptidase [Acuticoccus sp. I52.16.1]UOM36548.1 L,D-transpeptidase [Acuticoccus sp. I52.16.1]
MIFSRRAFVLTTPFALAACVTREEDLAAQRTHLTRVRYAEMYAAIDTEPFAIPAVDIGHVDPRFLRQEVENPTGQPAGTIVVDLGARHAYLVLAGGRALRYGIGVGKQEAFNFAGEATIDRKAEWPRWTPTPAMIAREPERYAQYADGLAGGLGNPLGPRALYLYRDGRDTLYRLHGTTEPRSIGAMVSSGCVRFFNQDIIDLYARVPLGTRVVVLPNLSHAVS